MNIPLLSRKIQVTCETFHAYTTEYRQKEAESRTNKLVFWKANCVRRRRTLPNFVGLLWTLAKALRVFWAFYRRAVMTSHSRCAKDSASCDTKFCVLREHRVLADVLLKNFVAAAIFFIWYVHEHDRLGFEMLTVETAVIHLIFILIVPIGAEKVSRIRSNIIWNRWKSTLRARSIWVNLKQGKKM